MAAPITHVVLAEKVYTKYFSNKNRKEFLVGTCFSDIRYLGVIDRSKTHYEENDFADILKSDAFTAGMRFHSFVDNVREKYMNEKGLYAFFPESAYLTQAVKIFEDEVLQKKIKDWGEIGGYFEEIDEGEMKFGIAEEDVERWHTLLRHYFSGTYISDEVIKRFVADMGRPESMSEEMIRVLKEVSDRDKAAKIVEDFYGDFEEIGGI
jgi:hypothetical protein